MTEIALQNENDLLKMILDNSFGNVFVTDDQGHIVYVNQNTVSALGVSRDNLLNMTIYELVDAGIADSGASIDALKDKTEITRSVRLASGTTLAVSAKPVFDASGKLNYVVVFSQNKMIVDRFLKSVQNENEILRETVDHVMKRYESDTKVIGSSKKLRECLAFAKNAAVTESTILITGESGAGKEVIARFIHSHSRRKKLPLITVNCAAIPPNLIESEFFGYEHGAFTGAVKGGKPGVFELADKGTLFLDEIGELDLALQAKLLRAIETGEFLRVGGSKTKKVDVRFIAATNRNLKEMVDEGNFREDLYYRLNVIPVRIPSLKERREDISDLAEHFAQSLNQKMSGQKTLSKDALERLADYSWPGNVRELRNVIERLFVIVNESTIRDYHVDRILENHENDVSADDMMNIDEMTGFSSLKDISDEFQRRYITKIVKKCHGNIELAAVKLGVSRSGLYKKLDKLGMKTKWSWED